MIKYGILFVIIVMTFLEKSNTLVSSQLFYGIVISVPNLRVHGDGKDHAARDAGVGRFIGVYNRNFF